eukprot:8861724-Ditylum_brightwellii.AAC.1
MANTGEDTIKVTMYKKQKAYRNLNKLKGTMTLRDEEEIVADLEIIKAIKEPLETIEKTSDKIEDFGILSIELNVVSGKEKKFL